MRTPFLVAALSSGLRDGVGHITLVSEESVLAASSAQRIASLASIVRDAQESYVCGDDFIGVKNDCAVQATSSRVAPELLLLCNLKTNRLSDDKRAIVIQKLQERLAILNELSADVPAHVTRTTIYSQKLSAWVNVDEFDRLPPSTVTNSVSQGESSSRSFARLATLGACVVLVGLGLIAFWYSRPNVSTPISHNLPKKEPGKSEIKELIDPSEVQKRHELENLIDGWEAQYAIDGKLDALIQNILSTLPMVDNFRAEQRRQICDWIKSRLDSSIGAARNEAISIIEKSTDTLRKDSTDEIRKETTQTLHNQQIRITNVANLYQQFSETLSKIQTGRNDSQVPPKFISIENELTAALTSVFDAKIDEFLKGGDTALSALSWLSGVADDPYFFPLIDAKNKARLMAVSKTARSFPDSITIACRLTHLNETVVIRMDRKDGEVIEPRYVVPSQKKPAPSDWHFNFPRHYIGRLFTVERGGKSVGLPMRISFSEIEIASKKDRQFGQFSFSQETIECYLADYDKINAFYGQFRKNSGKDSVLNPPVVRKNKAF